MERGKWTELGNIYFPPPRQFFNDKENLGKAVITPTKITRCFPASSCNTHAREGGRWKARSASPFLLPSQAGEGIRLSFSQASGWGGFKEKSCVCYRRDVSIWN